MRVIFFILWALCGAAQDGAKPVDRVPTPRPAQNPFAQQPTAIAAGRKIFANACSGCHGSHGEGERGPNLADGRLIRRSSDAQLFIVVQKGVPGTEMPPFPLEEKQIWQVLAYTRSLSAPAADAQVPGDAGRGRAIFAGKGGCTQCHMIAGEGGYLGPDLSNVGLTRSWRRLRDALLDPKSRSMSGFQGVEVVTKSGETLHGIAKNHTNYSLQLEDASGNLHLLESKDIQKAVFATRSIMPEDYERQLSSAEIDDVLAFLSKQAVRSPSQRNRPEIRTRRSP